MALEIAQFINILLLVLVTGVFWGTWFSLARSITAIAPETFLAIGRAMIPNLAVPMAILMPVALLSTVPVLVLLYVHGWVLAFFLTLGGLALFIVALVATLAVNVPIDNQIKRWTLAALPSNWARIRDHWERYHVLRTFASLGGLALIIAAALLSAGT